MKFRIDIDKFYKNVMTGIHVKNKHINLCSKVKNLQIKYKEIYLCKYIIILNVSNRNRNQYKFSISAS